MDGESGGMEDFTMSLAQVRDPKTIEPNHCDQMEKLSEEDEPNP